MAKGIANKSVFVHIWWFGGLGGLVVWEVGRLVVWEVKVKVMVRDSS